MPSTQGRLVPNVPSIEGSARGDAPSPEHEAVLRVRQADSQGGLLSRRKSPVLRISRLLREGKRAQWRAQVTVMSLSQTIAHQGTCAGRPAHYSNLMKTTRETVRMSDTVWVREGGMEGTWVVWVTVDDRPRLYGVYDSRDGALSMAAYVAKKAA